MNRMLPKFALALITAATCVTASAQTDQERRDRNRDEALTQWRAAHPNMARGTDANGRAMPAERRTMRERTHTAAQKTRRAGHRVAEKSRELGHKTAEKARDITDRTDAKFDKHNKPIRDPQGGGSSN